MELTWLNDFTDSWRAQSRLGRVPHAVMLQGPPGVGKRPAAAWMARHYLGMQDPAPLPSYPTSLPEHPDLHWLTIPEDKHSIGIDQIRELVADIRLTSYAGGGKVAVIEPATAMTLSAANSLLKTLEEPPGASLLILIADGSVRLPATVLSRCQRVSIAAPAESECLQWLGRLNPTGKWPAALKATGNRPLAALEVHERLTEIDAMKRDFSALAQGQAAPLDVAARWTRQEPAFVLDWLTREVQNVIYWACGCSYKAASDQLPDSVLHRIDRRNLFCYLDIINRLRGQASGSFNVQLALESLLIDWAEGLADCRSGNMPPFLGTR